MRIGSRFLSSMLLRCVALASTALLAHIAHAGAIPVYVAAAVADPVRPQKDTSRDPAQKPAEVLTFAGVKPGDRVADFWPAPPYSTRLLSKVVGESGHVYAILPRKLVEEVPESEEDVRKQLARLDNTTLVVQAFDQFRVPEPLDVVWLGKIYHDFPNVAEMGPLDIASLNKAIFDALKPGGVLIIVDHSAKPGSGFLDTEPDMQKRLHRIDPQVVRRQVIAAGFVFEAENKVLANPNDAHTQSAFDPAIREKTDRFVFKFRKPL
jgi:predicted methyltransferase